MEINYKVIVYDSKDLKNSILDFSFDDYYTARIVFELTQINSKKNRILKENKVYTINLIDVKADESIITHQFSIK